MRFSLKWLLIGTAYAAVAAAALTQDSWIWADSIWALSFVAFAFALVLACFARGPRQLAAAGFVAFSGCYLVCLQFAESRVPTARLLRVMRFGKETNAPSPPPVMPTVLTMDGRRVIVPAQRTLSVDLTPYYRAGNAVATMGFGLSGCLLAPLASMTAKPKTAANSV